MTVARNQIFVTVRKGTHTDCGHVGMYFGNPK